MTSARPESAAPAGGGRPDDNVLQAFRGPMRRTLVVTGIAFGLAIPIGTVVGWLLGGSEVGWGIFMGLTLPAVFLGLTVVLGLAAARLSNVSFLATVLGGWLVKMALLMVFLAVVRDMTFYDTMALFAALVVGIMGWLAAETIVVWRTREPYVTPRTDDTSTSAGGA